ncbi:MAG: hypothetical protein J2P25_00755 [Nocardiopsaceae bacterium]|nr:hypothetical protein [Nocardiopsaceae bacterium]
MLGIDFDDDHVVEKIAGNLSDLAWSMVDGVTWATLSIEYGDIVSKAIETAHRIEHALPGSRVDQLDEELVAVPDISARTKIHRETIRSWVTGTRGPGGFPLPKASLGGGDRGSMKVWRWADVNRWLDQTYSLGDGFHHPTEAQLAEINAYLARAEPLVTVLTQSGPSAVSYSAARNLESGAAALFMVDAHTSGVPRPAGYNMQAEAGQ